MIKQCKKCGIIRLKINFSENRNVTDGLYKQCKLCRKQTYAENLVKIKNIIFR